ncbi:MAG: hypothetical protein PHX61_06235 [Alphaproteobacteria bacterium]|nr:hypothetical protein [Alphaproteobacteria bacterium]
MSSPSDKYIRIDVTGNDAELQKVIAHQQRQIHEIECSVTQVKSKAENIIASSEELLKSLGKALPEQKGSVAKKTKTLVTLRPWDEISAEARQAILEEVAIFDLLSDDEIIDVEKKIMHLRDEYDLRHKLDMLDYGITGISGSLAAIVDIFLVRMPSTRGLLGGSGTKGGSLSDFFRDHLKKAFTPEEIKKLEKDNWVPYDASTSKDLLKKVDGLGPRSHRFQSLGHDPILGFIFGVKDIMCGSMTSIDTSGKLIIQSIPGAPSGMGIFEALIRQIGHLKSDIGTSAGLPAPFMPLLQMIQVGSIGEKGRTVGELTRAMYAQGYDFGHFLAMSVPVLIIEVLVRTLYFLKRLSEGYGFTESIPFNIPGQPRKPKLQTMLFIAHTIATAANAGKVAITENPLAINLPQWMWFSKSAIQQLQWVVFTKENERLAHVQNHLDADWEQINNSLLAEWSIADSEIRI